MWPFNKKPDNLAVLETVYNEWMVKVNARWTDLESRVSIIELNDKQYRIAARRKISAPQGEDLNSQAGGLLRRGDIVQVDR